MSHVCLFAAACTCHGLAWRVDCEKPIVVLATPDLALARVCHHASWCHRREQLNSDQTEKVNYFARSFIGTARKKKLSLDQNSCQKNCVLLSIFFLSGQPSLAKEEQCHLFELPPGRLEIIICVTSVNR